ncbi:protein canopy homolog 2 [Gastrophryne carolinensis]
MATLPFHWLLPALLLSFPTCALSRRGQDVRCGACRALVDEMEWEISQVNPKKTIQKESFRINPDGSQSVTEVPFARSETHLMDLLERVCENMRGYGEKTDPDTYRKTYVRVLSRDGKKLEASDTNLDNDAISKLKLTCEQIVEEHEDELIEFFSRETENVKDKLCSQRTDLCDHSIHITHDEL